MRISQDLSKNRKKVNNIQRSSFDYYTHLTKVPILKYLNPQMWKRPLTGLSGIISSQGLVWLHIYFKVLYVSPMVSEQTNKLSSNYLNLT